MQISNISFLYLLQRALLDHLHPLIFFILFDILLIVHQYLNLPFQYDVEFVAVVTLIEYKLASRDQLMTQFRAYIDKVMRLDLLRIILEEF